MKKTKIKQELFQIPIKTKRDQKPYLGCTTTESTIKIADFIFLVCN